MSNWTTDQYRDWMTRRLASEQRARERMQAHLRDVKLASKIAEKINRKPKK